MVGSISLRLGSGISYVAGTVNGVSKTFEQSVTDPAIWTAIVDIAADGKYTVAIQAYSSTGIEICNYTGTVYYSGIYFIFDRTQEDVDRVIELNEKGWSNMSDSEKAEWSVGMKGAFSLPDVMRIENGIAVIADLLGLRLTTRKDNPPTMPDEEYFAKLLFNVSQIRAKGYRYKDTPLVPVQPINTYRKLNAIERILNDAYTIYSNNYKYYCGTEIYAGEQFGLLL